MGSEIRFNETIDYSKRDSLKSQYLKTFNSIYTVLVDSTEYKSDFIFSKSLKNKLGFETYIDINSLKKGKHLLKVQRYKFTEKDTSKWVVANIPFWYYKE